MDSALKTEEKETESGILNLTGIPIHKILESPPDNKIVKIQAWVKQFRMGGGGKLMFLHLGDGQSTKTLQVIYEVPEDFTEPISFESTITVIGELIESPGKGQDWEIKASSITVMGECKPDDYPFNKGKKAQPLDFLRQYPHLRVKTRIGSSIMRMRSHLAIATHKFFESNGYFWIHTPLLTTSDCEGAGEAFKVSVDGEPKFFRDKQAYLTVSGQLQVEPFALALSKVYVFGPSFRAEKSSTSRHLSEFWMLEPEVAFVDLKGIIEIAEQYIKFVIRECLKYRDELEFLEQRLKVPNLIQKLEKTIAEDFAKITYTEAIDLLKKSKKKFEKPSEWGIDLGSDQEKYLCEKVFKRPTFITNYPSKIKAFYMYEDSANLEDATCKTVACMDLLMPGIGEVIGGSQREHRYEILEKKIEEVGLDKEAYGWYLDTRRFGGAPHSGFGVGFDRLLRYITGVDHIMDVVPYPVRYEHI